VLFFWQNSELNKVIWAEITFVAEWLSYRNVNLIHPTAKWFVTCICRFST